MNTLKSLYISAYLAAVSLSAAWACWQLWQGAGLAWWGVLLATLPMAAFFGRLFVRPVARTGRRLWPLLLGALAGSAQALITGGTGLPFTLALVVGVGGWAGYVFWYSSFGLRSNSALAVGSAPPAFTLQDMQGKAVSSTSLLNQSGLWLFCRGNWCPLCMAQVKEIAAQYRALAERGVQVHLISPQPASHTQSLSKRFAAPMSFWVDRDNAAAKALGILAENGLPAGLQALGYDSDVPMPTVFITNAAGRIIYSDLTSNYRIRPEPAEFLKVLDWAPSR